MGAADACTSCQPSLPFVRGGLASLPALGTQQSALGCVTARRAGAASRHTSVEQPLVTMSWAAGRGLATQTCKQLKLGQEPGLGRSKVIWERSSTPAQRLTLSSTLCAVCLITWSTLTCRSC